MINSSQGKYTIKQILDLLYSKGTNNVTEVLQYILKVIPNDDFEELIKNKDFNLVKVFGNMNNIYNEKIMKYLPKILLKLSIKKNLNVFKCYNNCGGCLLATIFICLTKVPSLENLFYSFIINALGDYEGKIIEKKSFLPSANKTFEILKVLEEGKDSEYSDDMCDNLIDSVWKSYIQGLGVLITDDNFLEISENDPKFTNDFIESFIIKENCFNKDNAHKLLDQLKDMSKNK